MTTDDNIKYVKEANKSVALTDDLDAVSENYRFFPQKFSQ
jgi:hypothetical protein